MKVTRQVELVAKKTGKSKSTVWRWRKDGCDISSSAALKEFLQGDKRRRKSNAVQKFEKENTSAAPVADPQELEHVPESDLNAIDLGPVGRRGAAAALQRLEEIEERAHARLMRAIENGNQFQVKAAQEFTFEPVRLCAGWIWQWKRREGTRKSKSRNGRLRVLPSFSRNG